MASLAMHMAIASEYCKKNNYVNEKEFLRGSIAPDTSKDKKKSHFTMDGIRPNSDEEYYFYVSLEDYVEENKIEDDFKKGEFMHLLTDKLFYAKFLMQKESVKNFQDGDQQKLLGVLYQDYNRVTGVLHEKYDLDLGKLPEISRTTCDKEPTLFKKDEIIKFIERCASINLQKEYDEINERLSKMKELGLGMCDR